MANSTYVKPAVGVLQSMIVSDVRKTDRIFSTVDGMKRKWLIRFDNGYEAEICPPEGEELNLKSGQKVNFNIKDRGKFGDTIELALQVPPKPPAVHLAATALIVAKDIRIAQAARDGDRVTTKEVCEEAELILNWLIEKCN